MRSARFRVTLFVAVATLGTLSATAGSSDARPAAKGDVTTISMLALFLEQPAFDVLVPNFERVYPKIKVNVTYAGSSAEIFQLESVELAAGNAPDLLYTIPGCGSPVSVCTLAKSGYLAPLLKEPWLKRSLPLLTSEDKYGQGLYSFTAAVSVWGLWTNDDLFRKLGLKIPRTFSQFLTLCQKAKAAGTIAYMFPGANAQNISNLIAALAVATPYGNDKRWAREHREGKVTFETTAGWHDALKHLIDMNNTGCFEPGAIGTTNQSAIAQFAQGQALMYGSTSQTKGTIDASNPRFKFSNHPFPGGTDPIRTKTTLVPTSTLGINNHSSAQNRRAAHIFVDFIGRAKQDALFAQLQGGVTQYQFLKGPIPAYMSDFSSVFSRHRYAITPLQTWWNASVLLALQENQIGLITGQRSIDDVLKAMDAAWKQGPQ